MTILRRTYSICYTFLPTALSCSVFAMLLLLPKAAHAQSTTLRPTSVAGTDTHPPSTLSSTASCDYGMSNCLLYNCNGCKNLFDDSCWGCHKCCASVKQDCIKGQADAVGFDKCGNGPTPQPTSPTQTPTLRSTLYPTSGKKQCIYVGTNSYADAEAHADSDADADADSSLDPVCCCNCQNNFRH